MNNNKNMGTLYSRCIGAINAKGIYIFSLDQDDLFFNNDVFDYIYDIAEDGKFDIIGFKSVFTRQYNNNEIFQNPISKYPDKLTLLQPELSKYPLDKERIYYDITIWTKSFKNEVYKKAVNLLGKKRYSMFLSWAEDSSMIFVIFNIAKSFKLIDKYGIIHLVSLKTASFTQPKDNKLFGCIFLLDIIFDFSKNNSNKNFAANFALDLKKTFKLNKFKNDKNHCYLNIIIQKILNCKFISKRYKTKIKESFQNFLIHNNTIIKCSQRQ